MLRSVVGAMAANMMLVQCGIRIAHLIGVLEHNVGDSPDLGIFGTASRWGPRRAGISQPSTDRRFLPDTVSCDSPGSLTPNRIVLSALPVMRNTLGFSVVSTAPRGRVAVSIFRIIC